MSRKSKLRQCRRCKISIMDQAYRTKYCGSCKKEVSQEIVDRTKITTKQWSKRNKDKVNLRRRNHRNENPDHYKKLEAKRSKRHPLYQIWLSMKTRCYNPTCDHFKDYGARGIVVCDRWKNSFENFLTDMGPRPIGLQPNGRSLYSLERNDVYGNYEPGNCRWATTAEQQNNRRISRNNQQLIPDNTPVFVQGEWISLINLSSKFNIPLKVLKYRFAQTPDGDSLIVNHYDNRYHEYHGHRYNVSELSLLSGKPHKLIYDRIVVKGWEVEKALSVEHRGRNV